MYIGVDYLPEVLGPVELGGMRQKVTGSEIAIETNNHCEELLHFIRKEIATKVLV